MTTTATDPLERIAAALELLNRRLKPVAELAERLNQEATGEDVKLVDSYVLGETKEGAPVIHLYPAHPKLQHRFCAVYEEKFDLLPFPVDMGAKQWEAGLAPPEKAVAIRKGYLNQVEPFRAVRLPTGKMTDGKMQYKFARALAAEEKPEAPEAPAPEAPQAPAQKPANGNGQTGGQAPRQPAPPAQNGQTGLDRDADRRKQQQAADRFKKDCDDLDIPNAEQAKLLKAAGGDYFKALTELEEFIKKPLPGQAPAAPDDDAFGFVYCDEGHEYPSNFFECPVCAEERLEEARIRQDMVPPPAAPAAPARNDAPSMLSPVEKVMADIEAEVARLNSEPARRYLKAAKAPNVPFVAMENILKSLRAMK